MKGAIIYKTKYGSTKQYAEWIAEATGLPLFDVKDRKAKPALYDFLVIGSPVIYYKLYIHKWMKRNAMHLENKPVILFSVSGAGGGDKLEGWMINSLPAKMIDSLDHVALRGRQNPKELTRFDRTMLIIAAKFNNDAEASKQELEGFDFMDKASIEPVVRLVEEVRLAD